MNRIINSTTYRAQQLTLQWLRKNGGRAKFSGGQLPMARALVRKGLARIVPVRDGLVVELTEAGRCDV